MLKQNDLVSSGETMSLEQRREFLRLPLSERWRILSHQAEEVLSHYEFDQSIREREAWQGGDIVEY